MQLKVVSLDVFFVADSGQHDTNHGHLHCVIQSTDGRFSCVLRGIIPQSNIYDVYNMTKGLKAGLTLTAAAGPAGSRPVKVLSLPAEDLDGMVYSKRMDIHTRTPGSFSPTKLLPATVPGAMQTFQLTGSLNGWLKWDWAVHGGAYHSTRYRLELSMVEVGVGSSSCKWQRELWSCVGTAIGCVMAC